MIKLADRNLAATSLAALGRYQRHVDAGRTYKSRVSRAKAKFTSCNVRTNQAFSDVRKTLTDMCSGACRCMYCEDSLADEVEHLRPKDLYPEVAFAWANYLYACGSCNTRKNNKFVVYTSPPLTITNVTRPRYAPIRPPAAGAPAFLHPRSDDCATFFHLDLLDTFFIKPRPGLATGSLDYARAFHTIEILQLNVRDHLPKARGEAYDSYRARLREYADEKESGATAVALHKRQAAILRMQHPFVWYEMKRQHGVVPELGPLFVRVPEALGWAHT